MTDVVNEWEAAEEDTELGHQNVQGEAEQEAGGGKRDQEGEKMEEGGGMGGGRETEEKLRA